MVDGVLWCVGWLMVFCCGVVGWCFVVRGVVDGGGW